MSFDSRTSLSVAISGLITLLPINAQAIITQEDASANPVTPLVQEPVSMMNVVQGITGLVLVLVVILGLAWLARRYGRFNRTAKGHLKIVDALTVGQREKIVIVQAGKKQLVVGITATNIQTLHVLDEEIVVDAVSTVDSFSDHLKSAVKAKVLS